MLKLIVDSTCDLPEEYIKENDILVLPLKVLLEDKEYLDGETINVDEVYEAMKKGNMPVTSQPAPETIYSTFLNYAKKGQDFIYLAFSSAMSGTFQLASSILSELKEEYPEVNMEVVDSMGGSTATGLIVMQTMEYIKSSVLEFKKALDYMKELTHHIEHIFTISDLNWLIKGGRIGKAQGMIGSILGINPILDVNDGRMEVIRKTRGRKKAFAAVVDMLEERAGKLKNQIIGISHADDEEAARELVLMIKERLGCTQFIVNKIGGVLGSHLGIGGVGVFFFNQEANLQADVKSCNES
ncbi:DegV family protein [Anaerocolumna xylanovorans]|uniref:EDD domain protein, DegV family n=1 Tax=Anaerocolumna xylanovorans DSM 12503 TaxID=1121345 RepID=A0A1M7YE07_9FIRM|nr:DegV family protein [Anaerocolumna xylanovorans]SHO50816.1 EDD domain protein, DegV family [Anaerocolumna xylanovorans DSM 12503]